MDKQTILTEASRIAQQTGVMLRSKFERPIKHKTKSNEIDIVTEADEQAEIFISRELLRLYPEHHLVGEEGGGQGADIAEAEYHWYVDPIDGTVNFANGIPHYCVSLALTDVDRRPIIGVIYEPNCDELYTAIKGEGAYLNGKKLEVTDAPTLLQSVVGSGFPYTKHSDPDNNTREWAEFTKRTRGIRRMGSAALDFAYVAAGRFDGYWEKNLKPWDALAGILLVTEAGGTVSDYSGGERPQWDEKGRFIASNGHIHGQMIEVLQGSSD